MKTLNVQQRIFDVLMSLGLNRSYYRRIRMMLSLTQSLDETAIRKKAQRLMVGAYVKATLATGLYFLYFRDLIFTAVVFAISLQTLLSRIMDTKEIQEALKKGLELLDSQFKDSEGHMELALKRTIPGVDGHVRKSFERILAIVSAPSRESAALMDAHMKNSHWIMGLLAKSCDYVQRHGDHVDKTGSSTFQNIIRRLRREVHSDSLGNSHIRNRTQGMGAFIIAPVFMLPLIKRYAVDMAYQMGTTDLVVRGFYEHISGQSIKIGILIMSVIFYGLYLDIKQSTGIFTNQEDVFSFLEQKRWVKRLIERITPEKGSSAYFKLKKRIIYSGTQRTVGMHRLRMIAFAFMGAVIGLVLVANSVMLKNYNLMHDIGYGASSTVYERNVTGMLLLYDTDQLEEIARKEGALIKELAELDSPPIDEVFELMRSRNLLVINRDTAERLIEKAALYGISRREILYAVLLSLGFFVVGLFIPDFTLIRKRAAYGERLLYEETMRLRTLVLILKEQGIMTSEKALKELERAAHIFKNELVEINVNYGGQMKEDAVGRIMETIDYQPFNDLLQRLVKAEKKMTLKEAFDDLDMNMNFDEDERRDKQRAISEEHVTQINVYASVGTILTTGIYLVYPLIYSTFEMMQSLSSIKT